METRIKLQNDQLAAEINLLGAELVFFGNRTGQNILWSKQTDHWNRIAPNLFPIVGRLLNDSYTFQEKSHDLSEDYHYFCKM